jgi:prepilin peptidase CpaA
VGISPWQVALILALVLAAAVVDLRCGKVPNWLTLPAIALALVGHALFGGLSGAAAAPAEAGLWVRAVLGHEADIGLSGALIGLAVGFLPLAVVWLAGGIGGGDAKLMGAIGALGGWKLAIGAMMYGFTVAALMAIFVMVYKGIAWRTIKRVWHTIVLLSSATRPADPTTKDSPQIPFAVALCLGTVLAMLSMLWTVLH